MSSLSATFHCCCSGPKKTNRNRIWGVINGDRVINERMILVKKKVLAAAAASVAALSLTACGSGESASSGVTGEVTLQMVDSQTSPARTALLKELLMAFLLPPASTLLLD